MKIFSLILCSTLLIASIGWADTTQPKRVLFVGNSYSALNGGLDTAITAMVAGVSAERITPNGYSFAAHFKDANTRSKIRSGSWDAVVLQDQSQDPIFNNRDFIEFGEKLAAEIRAVKAEPLLLMTWERPDNARAGVTFDGISAAYERLGATINTEVIPAGKAFQRARQHRPEIPLFSKDGHPTAAGTYLAACTVAIALFGRDVAFNDWSALVESATHRDFLQEIARAE